MYMHYPADHRLKNYVRYIYFHKKDHPGNFVIFPNIGAAITIYLNGNFIKEKDQYFRVEEANFSSAVLHVPRMDPVLITEKTDVRLISIVFYPLGVNQFIQPTLKQFVSASDRSLVPLETDRWLSLLDNLPSGLNKNTFNLIEKHLLQEYKRTDFGVFKEGIDILIKNPDEFEIDKLCKSIGTSVRTFHRNFAEHILLTPNQFRNLVRFRKIIDQKIKTPKLNFKNLAIENEFYDSSYFIKMFRKYTGYNPTSFFKKATTDLDGKYVYISV